MVEAPSIALAFAAGFVSFVSPCCLPLVPGYLAVVGGTTPETQARSLSPRLIGRSLLFVASFSAVFILLGLSATLIGSFLFNNKELLNRLAGASMVGLGVFFVASVFVVSLNREWRPAGLLERAGRGGPVLTGFAFAIAWTPCIGPTLGAILGLAALQQSTPQAAALLAVYSAGLAVPFLLSAVAFGAAQRVFGVFRRHHLAFQVGTGVLMAAMGALVFAGQLYRLNIAIRHGIGALGLDFLVRGL